MADDIASLGFEISSAPMLGAADALGKMTAASKTAEDAAARLSKSSKATAESHRLVGTEARRATDEMQRATGATTAHAASSALAAREVAGVSRAVGVLAQQAEEGAASLGRLGAFLQSFGLAGVVVGAIIAVVVLVIKSLVEAANRMGEFSRTLRDSAQVMGINTDQLQALNLAAATVGVSAERNAVAFERFTVQLNELRNRGTGPLFTELHQITPELVTQLAATTNVTSAIDLLAKAYANETDQVKKNAIARAAFGREGFDVGRVLTSINSAGGLEAYKAGLNAADMLTADQIKHWALLSIEIEHATNLAKNNFAAIFTGPVLDAEHHWAEIFLEISRGAKAFSISKDLRDLINPSSFVGGLMGLKPRPIETPAASFDARWGGMGTGPATTKPAFDAAVMKLWTSAMGSALTIAEQFRMKQLELAAAFDKSELGTKGSAEALDRLARAQAALNLDEIIAKESLRNSLLGAAAPVLDIVKQKMDEVQKAQIQGAGLTTAEIANIKRVTREQADGTAAIFAQTDAQKVQAATIGLSVGAAATLHEIMTLQLQDLRTGHVATEQEIADRKKAAEALGAQSQATAQKAAQDKANFDQQTVFLSQIDQQIAQVQKQLHGDAWQSFMNDGLSATIRLTDGLKQLKDAATNFATTLGDGLMSNKSLTDSLKSSFDNLAKAALSAGIKNALAGNFEMAAIDAAVAVASKLASGFFDDSSAKALEKAKQNFAAMAGDITKFNAAAAGFQLSPLIDEMTSLTTTFVKLGQAALDAHDNASFDQIHNTFQHGLDRIVNSYLGLTASLSDSGKSMAQAKADAEGMKDAILQAGGSMAIAADIAQRGLVASIDRIRNALSNSLQADIFSATGKGFINDIQGLVTQRNQLLAEGNASPELIQAHFAAMAQKIIDDAGLIGVSFTDLTQRFPDLTGVVQESTSALADQAKAAKDAADTQIAAAKQFQDSLNSAAKGIVDYVNNLRTGPQSSLAPSARLALAQSTYNATLGLAQGNNVDALGRITSDFENFRKAAQDFYGSSAAYQNILNTGIAQLLALPAVVTSTDPVVQALLTVQQKVDATTTAVGANTQSTASLLSSSLVKLDSSISQLVSTVNLLSQTVTAMNSSVSLLNSMNSLQTTATAQLQLLNQQLSGAQGAIFTTPGTAAGPFGTAAAAGGASVPVNNTLLLALNKIVINTAATVSNTALTAARVGLHDPAGFSGTVSGTFASGGIASPFSTFIFGEHHPQGPFFGRAGSSPVSVTPSMPSFANDNSALLAELRSLRQEVAYLRAESRDDARGLRSDTRNVDRSVRENTAHRADTEERKAQDARLAARRAAAA